MQKSRLLRLGRDALIISGISLALFGAIELLVRVAAPQTYRHSAGGAGSLGQRDPVLGHVYRPRAQVSLSGPEFSVEYRINAEGLRDEAVHVEPKPDGLTRVLILGDSFAFGAGNEYGKIWPVVLERGLHEGGHSVDVVKAGVSAYDTRKEALFLERLYARYEPDIVLLAFLPNDLFTNEPIGADPPPSATGQNRSDTAVRSEGDGGLTLHSVKLARRLLMHSDRLYTNLYMLTRRGDYFRIPGGERLERQLEVSQQLLGRIDDFCNTRGARLVVVSIPQQFQVIVKANDYTLDGVDIHHIDERLVEFANERDFPWISALELLSAEYRSRREELYYREDGHLTNLGNSILGEFLVQRLAPLVERPEDRTLVMR